jgi:hypothetical protein
MQVLCKSTSQAPDVCCPVCGQGFALVAERQSKAERARAVREVTQALRTHHVKRPGRRAHAEGGFLVAADGGAETFSGAAILGNAPSWAL